MEEVEPTQSFLLKGSPDRKYLARPHPLPQLLDMNGHQPPDSIIGRVYGVEAALLYKSVVKLTISSILKCHLSWGLPRLLVGHLR